MNARLLYLTLAWLAATGEDLTSRRERRDSDHSGHDRGDVPGWVMVTVMTAIVVVVLVSVFGQEVQDAVKDAFTNVRGAEVKNN